jgi:hypothetical protein
MGGYTKWPCIEGVPHHQKERKKKKKEKFARSKVDKYCVNYSVVKHPQAAKEKTLHDMIRT